MGCGKLAKGEVKQERLGWVGRGSELKSHGGGSGRYDEVACR